MAMNHRDVGSLGAEGAIAPPDFDRSVYPILVRGAHYTHHITTCPLPPPIFRPSYGDESLLLGFSHRQRKRLLFKVNTKVAT